MPKLSDYGYNKFSQFGEDGIIEKIFELIGTTSKVCVEFGAWDGFYLANTANLWTNGWQGVLIEADSKKFPELVQKTAEYHCRCILSFVMPSGENTIEEILKREQINGPIDLMSIDIDGDDYHIFDSLQTLRPRLLIVEYNPTIPAEIDLFPTPGSYFGCSAAALVRLGESKGYKLVAMTTTNCFFVLAADFDKFAEYETTIAALKTDKHLTYLMTGYGGHYIASREPTYGWSTPSNHTFIGNHFKIPAPKVKETPLLRALVKAVVPKQARALIRSFAQTVRRR